MEMVGWDYAVTGLAPSNSLGTRSVATLSQLYF